MAETGPALASPRATGPVELACELVAAATPNPPGDERAAADVVVRHLRRLGLEDVRVVGPTPERPNVLARIPGTGGGPTLLLNGHLDTKPPGDLAAWETPPWEPSLRDGRLYGLGSADMKGAVAAMAYAGAAIAAEGVAGDLVLAFTADEEAGSASGSGWLAAQGLLAADAAIIGEPCGVTREWEAIRLVSRGVFIFAVDVRGTQMHSSLSDQLPSVNASVRMSELIARMARESGSLLRYPPHPLAPTGPTLNPALVAESGLGYGVLSGSARFLSDVRLLPGMTREGITEDLEAFLDRARADDPSLDATLVVEHWLPPCEIAPDHPAVAALAAAAAEVFGTAPPFAVFPGGTDAPHLQLGAGIPTVPSCGPGLLTAAHRPNEWVSVDGILEATDLYTRTARRFLDG